MTILTQVNIDKYSHEELDELMRGLGFEEDVPYAKSLINSTVINIYEQCK